MRFVRPREGEGEARQKSKDDEDVCDGGGGGWEFTTEQARSSLLKARSLHDRLRIV